MHRGLPAVLVQSLRCGAPGIFGNRQLLPCLFMQIPGAVRTAAASARPVSRSGDTGGRAARSRQRPAGSALVRPVAAAEADRGRARCNSDMRRFSGWLVLAQLAAPRADFVLRRDRQFVEPRHPRRTRRRPLRLRRDERRRLRSPGSRPPARAAAGSMNSDGLGAIGRIVTSSTPRRSAALAASSIEASAAAIAASGSDATMRRRGGAAGARRPPPVRRFGARCARRCAAFSARECRCATVRMRGRRRRRRPLRPAPVRCRWRRPRRGSCRRGFRRRWRRR